MWCASRGSPDSTTRPVWSRVPSRTRWWCTPATASSAGIGTRSRPAARSETIRMLSPLAISSDASRQRRSIARARPAAPSSTGQVASSVSASNTSWSTWRSFSSSPFERIGWPMISWWACSGVSVKQVRLRADARSQAHHDLLADRVDRRVRDLREQLLEVRVERRLAVVRTASAKSLPIEPIGSSRLGAAHARERDAQVLLRVAEHLLAGDQRVRREVARRDVGHVVEVDRAVAVPLAVGLLGRDLVLDLVVLDDAAVLDVDAGTACPAGAGPSPSPRRPRPRARRSRTRAPRSRRS